MRSSGILLKTPNRLNRWTICARSISISTIGCDFPRSLARKNCLVGRSSVANRFLIADRAMLVDKCEYAREAALTINDQIASVTQTATMPLVANAIATKGITTGVSRAICPQFDMNTNTVNALSPTATPATNGLFLFALSSNVFNQESKTPSLDRSCCESNTYSVYRNSKYSKTDRRRNADAVEG